MKARNWLILAGLAGLSVQPAVAGGIPQPKGQFAETASGSFAICLDPTSFKDQACSTPGVLVVPLTLQAEAIITSDKAGNSCASLVEVDSDLPVDITAPFVSTNEHITGTTTKYDSSTGSGDGSFTGYTGGSCNGASFDNTGAMQISSGTVHFIVSEQGKRLDFLITSLTNPNASIGDFSVTGVNRAQ
jgi:hypothetical protein